MVEHGPIQEQGSASDSEPEKQNCTAKLIESSKSFSYSILKAIMIDYSNFMAATAFSCCLLHLHDRAFAAYVL